MSKSNEALVELLKANENWYKEFNKNNPGFLKKIATEDQRPKVNTLSDYQRN